MLRPKPHGAIAISPLPPFWISDVQEVNRLRWDSLTVAIPRRQPRDMTETELPITGYLDRFSHRPGETFTAFVSVRDGGAYRARLVRVLSGDPNPNGPGVRFENIAHRFDQSFGGRRQAIRLGSHGIVDAGPHRDIGSAITWTVLVHPGLVDAGQALLAEETADASVTLSIGVNGATAHIGAPGATIELSTGTAMRPMRWYRVWLAADMATGRVMVGQQPLDGQAVTAERRIPAFAVSSGGTLLFAARNAASPTDHFTGKLEDPAILRGFVTSWPDVGAPLPALGDLLAGWDFSRGIDTQTVEDTGPQACHGRLVNMPARAMVGTRWSGREQCWRHAPSDYGAIHFHADDLADCDWQAEFTWTVPDELRSGAYALHLTCKAGEDWLPLYVLPKRKGPFAPIAFLASTFTYQAYADHERTQLDEGYRERVAAWHAYPYNPMDYPIYGRSTYNKHRDGSGISFSSRRRPILTMRPGFLTFCDPRGSGMRHYPADLHLLAWLEAKGFDFDIVTDEDLDDEGVALIAPYRTVLTGSHPEYHTLGTLDALAAYTRQSGRLCYLGGNGFYWRVARSKAMPHVIELRRAEGGIRTWAAEPGEYYHQMDGQLGGLWRRNRRPPQMLAGVGFSCQAGFEGTHYRRLPASRDPRYAWMFDGIEEDVLGDYGLSGGGAAGFELDRADPALGTPEGTAILARSEDNLPSFLTVPEELLSNTASINGEAIPDLARGEIVYFDTPSGGAVFSVGSITFCGSLWRNGFEGPISRLLENVVRHFTAG
jgi:N,N-dimethylformamidase